MENSDAMDTYDIVDTPLSYRPDLSEYGIVEVDNGVCQDTAENRRILRKHRLTWHEIFDTEGQYTSRLEVISEDMLRVRTERALDAKKTLLVDPRNKNSDYLSGINLIVSDTSALVPPWVIGATNTYEDLVDRRNLHPEKKIRPHISAPPGRCAFIKSDGVRCQMWHSGRTDANGLCRTHLGSLYNTPAASVERARRKISQYADRSVEVLAELADEATSEAVRQRAADSLLDRAGIRGGSDLNISTEVTVVDAADEIRERLRRLQEGAAAQLRLEAIRTADEENTEDAVIIEDGQDPT